MASHPDHAPSNPQEPQINLQQLVEMLLSLQDRLGQIEHRQTHQPPQRSTTIAHLPASTERLPESVKLPKPSTYHGNSNRLDSWIYELELYFVNLGVPESRKVGLAVSFLRDAALLWWRSMCQRGNMPTTWDTFTYGIRSQFLPKNQYQAARNKLRNLRQTGSVQQYNLNFNSITLEVPDLSNAEALDKYIAGLKPQTRSYVMLQYPQTMEEAMRIADTYDTVTYANNRQISTQQPMTNRTPMYPPVTTNEPMPMEIDAIKIYNQPRNASKAPLKKLTDQEKKELLRLGKCFRCREHGHRAAECPRYRPSSPSHLSGNGRAQ